jgi:hypothetical protein
MNKILKSIIFTGLLLGGITAACNLPFVSDSQTVAETPILTLTVSPAETVTPAPAFTESAPPASSATPEFAPFCDVNSAPLPQCQLPVVKESSTFCARKDPYTLILMNKGLTYEVLTEGFKCSDAGVKNDKQMVTCTGQMAASFEINVCDPACVVPTVQAVVTQCQQGYNYNNLQGCCTNEIQLLNRNCMVFNFKTTSCVVDCSQFTTKKTCEKNSFACVWSEEDKGCVLRQ